MTTECEKIAGSMMHISSPDSVRNPWSAVSSKFPSTACSPRAPGKKVVCGARERVHRTFYDRKVRRVRDLSCGDTRVYLEFENRRVSCRSCGTVKQETLNWLADNPFYTKRFAFYVGRRCRAATIQDVARELGGRSVSRERLRFPRQLFQEMIYDLLKPFLVGEIHGLETDDAVVVDDSPRSTETPTDWDVSVDRGLG
jgi:hypothetical protein